jgi:soluble lytic murein transglycosylase-like protein
MDAPNSYKDPYWATIAANAERKQGLPEGLLTAIFTHGEKTNNDQVSGAGAKTPFQIIPETRNLFLKKYGIDAYLSPENAAEVGALHVKESLDRNKGDAALAVAEYHAGPDRKNWGPITAAYTKRVMAKYQPDSEQNPLRKPWQRSKAINLATLPTFTAPTRRARCSPRTQRHLKPK